MSAPARPAPRQLWLVWLGVSAIVFALLLTTAAAISVTWDEPIYSQAAENAARWFGTLLRGGPGGAYEQTAFGVGWGLVNEHPPLVRVLNGLGWAVARGALLPADRAPGWEHGAGRVHRWRAGRGHGAAVRGGRRAVCRRRSRDHATRLLSRAS